MLTNAKKRTRELQGSLAYAENIIAILRDSFEVLGRILCVCTANIACYTDFRVVNEQRRQVGENTTVLALRDCVIRGLASLKPKCSP